jgi:hypothetical protein
MEPEEVKMTMSAPCSRSHVQLYTLIFLGGLCGRRWGSAVIHERDLELAGFYLVDTCVTDLEEVLGVLVINPGRYFSYLSMRL